MNLETLLSTFSNDGKDFERLTKWFLQNDPSYSATLKTVWLWDEWPGRFGPDCGIDLVAETFDGDLWAIQAKNYAEGNAVSKRDVDSFLSESGRTEFSYRLLVMSTNLLGANAERTIAAQSPTKVGIVRLSQLEASPLDWNQFLIDTAEAPYEPLKLREHQEEALEDILEGFRLGYDRGQCLMACGTGKTLVALRLSEALDCESVLVLIPSLNLLKQTRSYWLANKLQGFKTLAVCSDETVVDATGNRTTVSTSEAIHHLEDDIRNPDLGFPVTTHPEEIKHFLSQPGKKVVFSTYQSSPQLVEEMHFNLAVADESHRCAGDPRSAAATVIHGIQADKKLFMTATPRYIRPIRGRENEERVTMDDETQFGPVFHSLSFFDAIERQLLCDYEVVVSVVKDDIYSRWVADGHWVAFKPNGMNPSRKSTDARTLAAQVAVALAIRENDLKKIISFHNRVANAQFFANTMPFVIDWLPEEMKPAGAFDANHISGEMPTGKRDNIIHNNFAGFDGCSLLTNARLLSEGVDVPAIDGVAFIEPKRSMVDIIQAVGRAIRLSEDKSLGRIIIGVVIDEGADVNETINGTAFRTVWDVVRALKAHEGMMAETLPLIRSRGPRPARTARRAPRVRIMGAEDIGDEFARAFESRVADIYEGMEREDWLILLEQFVAREGHALVPHGHVEHGDW